MGKLSIFTLKIRLEELCCRQCSNNCPSEQWSIDSLCYDGKVPFHKW